MKIALIAIAVTLMTTSLAMAQQPASSDQAAQAYIDTAFGRIDTNSDGSISKEEFKAFTLARLSQQKAAFEGAFNKADTNKDGKISKEEAAAANPQLAANFTKIDGNSDGFVTADEIRAAVMRAQSEQTASN
ncbi:MAG TPA: EF-hand domain-containing protein [Pedomonas sp.]|uniref:EF-hand domain-containing protein n=1 Tax=Pedomonas sp. TaxID=2976421 RepID=UPI002F3F9931